MIRAIWWMVRFALASAIAFGAAWILWPRRRRGRADAEAAEYGIQTIPLSRAETRAAAALERELLERA